MVKVEWAVEIFKESIKRSTTGSLETRVNRFLFHYRTTPHTTTGVTPAELLMGWRLRTHLDLIHPDLMTKVQRKQKRQAQDRNKRSQDCEVQPKVSIFVKDLPSRSSWIPGIVLDKRGPRSYLMYCLSAYWSYLIAYWNCERWVSREWRLDWQSDSY